MGLKKIFSKRTGTIAIFIWTFISSNISITTKDIYHLSFGIYLCIAVPLIMIGQNLITKFTQK
jgi:hypothetical protein